MNRKKSLLALLVLVTCFASVGATRGAVDADSYLHDRGWKRVAGMPVSRSSIPDVTPLVFYEKNNTVPSCGLLIASPGAREPVFVDLVGSEPGVGFPQCLGIAAITPFKLQDREYVAVEYLSRETREDVDRRFHYLVRTPGGRFAADQALTAAAPVMSVGQGARRPAPVTDAVRFARIFQLAKAQGAWRLLERDVISDKSSSFMTFEDKKRAQCQFVTEAGSAPVAVSSAAFAPLSKCDGVLASSRLETGGKLYYLALFKTSDRKQLVALTSVAGNGRIEVEKNLAESINRRGTTADVKTVKAALVREIN